MITYEKEEMSARIKVKMLKGRQIRRGGSPVLRAAGLFAGGAAYLVGGGGGERREWDRGTNLFLTS